MGFSRQEYWSGAPFASLCSLNFLKYLFLKKFKNDPLWTNFETYRGLLYPHLPFLLLGLMSRVTPPSQSHLSRDVGLILGTSLPSQSLSHQVWPFLPSHCLSNLLFPLLSLLPRSRPLLSPSFPPPFLSLPPGSSQKGLQTCLGPSPPQNLPWLSQ